MSVALIYLTLASLLVMTYGVALQQNTGIEKRSADDSGIVPECIIDCGIPDRGCPDGQKPDQTGQCRDEWGRKKREVPDEKEDDAELTPDCIIGCHIPDRDCPEGQKPDENGVCRDVWPLFAKLKKLQKREVAKQENSTSPIENETVKTKIEDTKKNVEKMTKGGTAAQKSKSEKHKAKKHVPKGKHFMKKKKTTTTTEQPNQPAVVEDVYTSQDCLDGHCKPIVVPSDRFGYADSESESSEEDSDSEEDSETEDPDEVDEELMKEVLKLKLIKFMKILEFKKRYGPLIGKWLLDDLAAQEEEEAWRT